MSSDSVHIVIPARRADPLFPDKIMAMYKGKPLIWHVWQQAVSARLGEVTVACDDSAVFDYLTKLGMVCVMTSKAVANPYQRAAQALEKLGNMDEIVVVLPADIPTLSPAALRSLIPPLWRADVDVSLLAWPEADTSILHNPIFIKAAVSESHHALFLSRCMIPYGGSVGRCLAGPSAMRRDTLNRLVERGPVALEREENIFLLRALDMGFKAYVSLLDKPMPGIKTPDDLKALSQ